MGWHQRRRLYPLLLHRHLLMRLPKTIDNLYDISYNYSVKLNHKIHLVWYGIPLYRPYTGLFRIIIASEKRRKMFLGGIVGSHSF